MPLYGDPVIQSLEWQVRVCRRLEFNDHQSAVTRHGEQVDHIAFRADETRNLRVNVLNIDRRKHLADLTHEIRLQPSLLVSARQRMAASIAACRCKFPDDAFNGLAQWIDCGVLRHLSDINTPEADRYRACRDVGDAM